MSGHTSETTSDPTGEEKKHASPLQENTKESLHVYYENHFLPVLRMFKDNLPSHHRVFQDEAMRKSLDKIDSFFHEHSSSHLPPVTEQEVNEAMALVIKTLGNAYEDPATDLKEGSGSLKLQEDVRDFEGQDDSTQNTGPQEQKEREDKDAGDQVVEDADITVRYPILKLDATIWCETQELINTLITTNDALGVDLGNSEDAARFHLQQYISGLIQTLCNHPERYESDDVMSQVLELQGLVRKAAALKERTPGTKLSQDSETNEDEKRDQNIDSPAEGVVEDADAMDRYPILKLKRITSYSTQDILEALITTNDALGDDLKVSHDHELSNVVEAMSGFITEILDGSMERLSNKQKDALRKLQGTVRMIVAPSKKTSGTIRRPLDEDFEAEKQDMNNNPPYDADLTRKRVLPPIENHAFLYYEQTYAPTMRYYQKHCPETYAVFEDITVYEMAMRIVNFFTKQGSDSNLPSSYGNAEAWDDMRFVLSKLMAAVKVLLEVQGKKSEIPKTEDSNRVHGVEESQEQAQAAPPTWKSPQQTKIRDAMGPTYVQLLKRAKWLEDSLPNFPDLESLIIQPYLDEKDLCALSETEDEAVVLAKAEQLFKEVETYGGTLLKVLQKLTDTSIVHDNQPSVLPGKETMNQRPLQQLSKAELKERLRSFCQDARRKTLLESTRGCQELWKQYERECKSLCPDDVQLEVHDCVSALTKTRAHLFTLLQAVPEAAWSPCLLEERVELVSSQVKWLCEQLEKLHATPNVPWWRVRFLRVFQRLLFLTGVCSLTAQ